MFLAVSCTARPSTDDTILKDGLGGISLSPMAITSTNDKSENPLKVPTIEEFIVDITPTNPENEEEPFSAQFADIPVAIALEEGEYKVETTAGFNEPFTTNSPTYYASTTATVEVGRITNVKLTATMLSYAVEVKYGADLMETFDEYWVEVQVGRGRYEFARDTTSAVAYITPGESRYLLKGTLKNGKNYSAIFTTINSNGREHHILNLSIRPLGNNFEIVVDSEMKDLEVNADVNPEIYPDMPQASCGAMQFYETALSGDGEEANSNVTLNSLTTLRDGEIRLSDEKFANYGIDTTRIFKLSEPQDVNDLSALGIEITDGGVTERNATLNFGKLAEKLETVEASQTTYNVEIKSIDEITTKDGEYANASTNIAMNIAPPVFSMAQCNPADIWSMEFTISPITVNNITKGNLDIMTQRGGFIYQFSTDNTTWREIDPIALRVAGLPQRADIYGDKYYIRALYRGNPSSTVEFNLEGARQIPNSDFATHHTETKNGQPCYWFFASGAAEADQWWTTRNSKTTNEGIDSQYTRYSGARPTDGAGVELVTCGWGSGNTNAGLISVVHNTWAGAIFLGTYSLDTYDNSVNEHHGREFNARPTAMKFDYKYYPYNDNDNYIAKIWLENRNGETTTTLASGQSTSTSKQDSFKAQTINLTYTHMSLPITHICIAFYSGKNEYRKAVAYSKNPKVGSKFNVNNVTLIYGK